jgi:hypothetical protein
MEYQCFYLKSSQRLDHDPSEVLFEHDSLAHASTFVYTTWLAEKRDIAVYQPRHKCYRELYRMQPRDALGRFRKRIG